MVDVRAIALDGRALVVYLDQNPVVGYQVMKRVAQIVSYRLGIIRRCRWRQCVIEKIFQEGKR